MPNIPYDCKCGDNPKAMGFHSYECQEFRRWLNAEYDWKQYEWLTAEREFNEM